MITVKSATEIEFHFQLDNQSHSMDAKVLHSCNAEILNIITTLSNRLSIPLIIETEALSEGGIKQIWKFLGDNSGQLSVLISVIALIIALNPQAPKKTGNEDRNIELQNKNLELQNTMLELEIQELQQKSAGDTIEQEIVQDIGKIHEIVIARSKYYQTLVNYPKVLYVEYSAKNNANEIVYTYKVDKSNFVSFVRETELCPDIINNEAKIILISPVLIDKKYKWKGFYQNEVIDFFMNDEKFKEDVKNKTISFQSGTVLNCKLITRQKIDETDLIKVSSYAVDKVVSIQNSTEMYLTTVGKIKAAEIKLTKDQALLDFKEEEKT